MQVHHYLILHHELMRWVTTDEKRIAIEEKKVSLILIRKIHAIFTHTNPRMYFMEGQMVSISIVNCPS